MEENDEMCCFFLVCGLFYFLEDDLTFNWLIRPYLVHQQLDDHNNPLKPLVDLEHLGLVNNIVEKHLPEE